MLLPADAEADVTLPLDHRRSTRSWWRLKDHDPELPALLHRATGWRSSR